MHADRRVLAEVLSRPVPRRSRRGWAAGAAAVTALSAAVAAAVVALPSPGHDAIRQVAGPSPSTVPTSSPAAATAPTSPLATATPSTTPTSPSPTCPQQSSDPGGAAVRIDLDGDGVPDDTSALARLAAPRDFAVWAERIERGLVRIATVTRLEVGYSARSGPDLRKAVQRRPLAAMPVEYQTPAVEERAIEVQMHLADQGHQRVPSVPDLIVAATAKLAGLTVLHVDKDFELIAEITDQDLERLAI